MSKYKKPTLDLSRKLLLLFKSIPTNKNKSTWEFSVIFANLELDIIFTTIKNNKLTYSHSLSGEADDDTMELTLEYNSNFFPMAYTDVLEDLRGIIRHELEHIGQQNFSGKVKLQLHGDIPFYKYLLLRHEIPAYISEFNAKAKFRNVTIDDIMDKYFSQVKASFNTPSEMKLVRDKWTTEGKKLLPKSNWKK